MYVLDEALIMRIVQLILHNIYVFMLNFHDFLRFATHMSNYLTCSFFLRIHNETLTRKSEPCLLKEKKNFVLV